jgi:hypothetical protein
LVTCKGGTVVFDEDEDDEEVGEEIHWVTDVGSFSSVKTDYIAYGNEASLGCLYGDVCLVLRVGPMENRKILKPIEQR